MKSPMVQGAGYIEDKGNYSELMVLRSAAGWYIGTIYHNPDGYDEPGSRDSDYYVRKEDAEQDLTAMASECIGIESLRMDPIS